MSTICQDHRDGRDDNEVEYWGKMFRIVRYAYDPSMHFRAFMSYSLTKRRALLASSDVLLRSWRERHQDAQTKSCIDYLPPDPEAHVTDTTCVTVTIFQSHNQN